MSRVESFVKIVDALNNSEGVSAEEAMSVILAEIAGSLAVIADALVDKDGENNE